MKRIIIDLEKTDGELVSAEGNITVDEVISVTTTLLLNAMDQVGKQYGWSDRRKKREVKEIIDNFYLERKYKDYEVF